MSIRIHVVAAFGASERDFRAALDSMDETGSASRFFRIGSSGRWMWGHASVWTIDGHAIDQALSNVGVPGLRVTSSDGVLWMLSLQAPGKKLFRGVHHFTQVGRESNDEAPATNEPDSDFPEDEIDEVAGINRFVPELAFLWDADEEAILKAENAKRDEEYVPDLENYSAYGVELPRDVIDRMKVQPFRASRIAFDAHATQLVDALTDYGFEFDRPAMHELLTVGPLTELESSSDLGNMPRFLQQLGIEGLFQHEVEPDDTPDDENEEADPSSQDFDLTQYPPGNLFVAFDQHAAKCPVSEIRGGPVRISHLALLHLLSHFLSEDPPTSIWIQFPSADAKPTAWWNQLDSLEARREADGWRFCFSTRYWWYAVTDRHELDENPLSRALTSLPEGTSVDITLKVEGLAEKFHRYTATFRGGNFQVDHAYPAISAEVFEEALELIDQFFGDRPIALASKEEETEVRRIYKRSQESTPKIRNGKIKPEIGSRDDVIRPIFFERFKDRVPWDILGARRLDDNEWQQSNSILDDNQDASSNDATDENPNESTGENADEVARIMETVGRLTEEVNRLQEEKKVPHRGETLYEGISGRFLRASLSDLPHLSTDDLQNHDAIMASLGFQAICDSTGDVDQQQEITRCYAGHSQALALLSHRNENNRFGWAPIAHGMVMVDFTHGTREFHTHFDDGTALVTTSIQAISSKPEIGIFVRCYEDVPINTLWEKHADGIARFKQHRQTVPIDHSQFTQPVRFLARMDELLCRFLGKG